MSLNSIKLRMRNMIVISDKIWHKDAVSMLRLGVLFTSLWRQASPRFSRSTVISRENYHISKSTQLGGFNEGPLTPHRITPSSPQPMTYIWKGCWLAQRFRFIYAKLHSTKTSIILRRYWVPLVIVINLFLASEAHYCVTEGK